MVTVSLLEYNYEHVYDKLCAFCWLSAVDYIKVTHEFLGFVIYIFSDYSKFAPKFCLSSHLEQF